MLQEVGVHEHLFFPDFVKHFPDFHLCHVELRLCTDSTIEESAVGMNLVKEAAQAQAVDRTLCAQNALLLSFRLSLILNLNGSFFRLTSEMYVNTVKIEYSSIMKNLLTKVHKPNVMLAVPFI